jgi:hypothetical protein
MRKLLTTIGFTVLSTAALAATPHGSSGAGGMSSTGGMSNSHMSTSGMANTNGPNAADRDFGRDRAEDRRARAAGTAGFEASARVDTRRHHHRFNRFDRHFDFDRDRDMDRGRDRDRDFDRDR